MTWTLFALLAPVTSIRSGRSIHAAVVACSFRSLSSVPSKEMCRSFSALAPWAFQAGEFFVVRLPCALWCIEWHPWSPSTRYREPPSKPSCHNTKRLQTWPHVPRGPKSSPVEISCPTHSPVDEHLDCSQVGTVKGNTCFFVDLFGHFSGGRGPKSGTAGS